MKSQIIQEPEMIEKLDSLKDSIDRIPNILGTMVVKELRKYIDNQRQVIEQLQFMIDKHVHKEEYEVCADYSRMKKIQEMQVFRLERIIIGLPAFEPPKMNIADETTEKIN